ncbi:MAG: FKBP-type peptidyl-prolyl cis-trans isomerase [Methanolobus sp.]|nr:FKBP-type peptidyl-prolyl cis-trans isomerase [Methanolobus sp.]
MNIKNLSMILILGSVLLLSGCVDNDSAHEVSVENGDIVTLDYTLMYEDGTVIETSNPATAESNDMEVVAELLVFEVGAGQMLAAVDEAVLGMVEGERKSLTLSPEEAFGPYREDLVQAITIPEYQEATNTTEIPHTGEMLMTPTGPLTVADVNETHILLDANSPLAGETLVFYITVVSIEKSEELSPDLESIPVGSDN